MVKRLFLIRHAKSSWAAPGLDDFARPLNKRGKKDAPEMAARLVRTGVVPDLVVASPAKRARKTAIHMAEATGYEKADIRYDDDLYLGILSYHLQLITELLHGVDTLFLVGHNNTVTELAEYLTGRYLGNVPTCGIVALEFTGPAGFTGKKASAHLLFFDFPKNSSDTGIDP